MDFDKESSWCYCRIDSRIVAIAMRQLHDPKNNGGFPRATLSGDAWACVKKMFSKGKGFQGENWRWDYYFPKLSREVDDFVRGAYFGGINYSSNKGVNRAGALPIYHEDIHNSYGAVMMWDPLPFGVPVVTHSWPLEGVLYVADIEIRLKLRKGLKGWYQFKNGIDNILEGWPHGTIVEETKYYHRLRLTSIDLASLSDWYEVDINPEYEPTFMIFKSKSGIIKDYLD